VSRLTIDRPADALDLS